MQFPKLTPLQSRFAACLGTSILLLILYFTISPPQFAYASELVSVHNEDHNHHRIDLDPSSDIDWGDDTEEEQYEAEFSGFERSIIGRAAADVKPLTNNVPDTLNVAPGETIYYVFENSSVWGNHSAPRQGLPSPISGSNGTIDKRDIAEDDWEETEKAGFDGTIGIRAKRQAVNSETRAVYIAVNTCLQPSMNSSMNDTSTFAMPQLTLYVSQLESNPKPGPDKSANDQQAIPLVEGYANATIDASSNVYFSVSAPNLTSALTGQWNYIVSASIDASFQYYNNTTPFTFVVDTDSTSALLNTMNLTDPDAPSELRQQWMNISPPFNMLVFAQNTTVLNGIRNSYCGLTKLGQDEIKISSNMTNRGVGQNPKQQFYVQGLEPGQKYYSILAFNGVNGTADPASGVVGGGGQVWQALSFATKSDGNCKIIYDLPFCSNVAYAVPSNATAERAELVDFYDNNAAALYQNFSFSLQQIPCNTSSSAQYSLARNCDDCARDYKTWLCAVTIPRCTDFSTPNTPDFNFLMPRAVGQPSIDGDQVNLEAAGLNTSYTQRTYTNSSRVSLIDSVIKPGPYKELLPCEELCYNLVQSCPAALGFGCPKQGFMIQRSYGAYDPDRLLTDGTWTCNYLGIDWPNLNAAPGRGAASVSLLLMVSVVHAVLVW